MLTLLKNTECYSPQYLGKKDILIAFDKILKITQPGSIDTSLVDNITDCSGLYAFPGIIDAHVHIIGGGGEKGFASRIPELDIKDITAAGVSTLVGVLGFDSSTKDLRSLLAKARALEIQGITAYIYTGSYAVPTVTITGGAADDIILIDKIIGTGEIAISDHRSSVPTISELSKLAANTHMGGLLANKAGVVHIHVGDGKQGLSPLQDILNQTELPMDMFVPTHTNRTPELFRQAAQHCKSGGNIDLTAGESQGVTVPNAISDLLKENIDLIKVTVSSDANGSIPSGGVGKMQTLYNDIKNCIIEKNIPIETAFSLVTENVANILKLYPKKGALKEGSDADILITDRNLNIKKLFCMGRQINE